MNVKNNKRRKESQEKIEKSFIELLQTRELKEITVSDIIKSTGLNRSTFYANYVDILDLADKTRHTLENTFSNLFADYDYFNERSGALKMFKHIKENQIFYKENLTVLLSQIPRIREFSHNPDRPGTGYPDRLSDPHWGIRQSHS